MTLERQEFIDAFYWSKGPCCAGCDHWQHFNSILGECTATPPGLSGEQRAAFVGFTGCSTPISSGHALTERDYHCGAFVDSFPWGTLPLMYRKRVGAPLARNEVKHA